MSKAKITASQRKKIDSNLMELKLIISLFEKYFIVNNPTKMIQTIEELEWQTDQLNTLLKKIYIK